MESFVEFVFHISHFSSTACTAAMAKRAQQESGEERVTAKLRPVMNLTARMPSVVSSSTSSNLGGPRMGIKILGNLLRETIDQGIGASCHGFSCSWTSVMGSSVRPNVASISDRSRDSVKAYFVPFCCAVFPCIQYSQACFCDWKEYST